MSVMSELHLDIQEMLLNGDKSFEEIANILEIPVSWVTEVAADPDTYYGA
jgi:NADH:ubiquinone oxidoreductase subunit E